jgi:hypothetical protein
MDVVNAENAGAIFCQQCLAYEPTFPKVTSAFILCISHACYVFID